MNKGIFLSILSVLLMTTAPVLNKFAVQYSTSISAALQNMFFGIILSFFIMKIRRQKLSRLKNKSIFLIAGLNAAGMICLYSSIKLLNPVTMGLIGRFYIIFALIFSVVFLKEHITKLESLFMGTAVMGVFFFIFKSLDINSIWGMIFAFAYALLFALCNMLVKIKIKELDSSNILFFNNLISFFIILITMVLFSKDSFSIDVRATGYIFLSSLLSNCLGMICFYESLKYLDFGKSNIIRSFSPIMVFIWSLPFFPLKLSFLNVSGAIIIILSLGALSLLHKKLK